MEWGYNAEKKKIGMYYTTPVYQFRMKCHLCDNHFEIKTDPGNLEYIIVSGARRQENRWDPTENGQVVPDDKETVKRLYDDAMFKLEHNTSDKQKSKKASAVIDKLMLRNDSKWKDDFTANCELRAQLRLKKKELKAKEKKDNALLKKSSLAISLLPEHEDDIKLASLLKFQSSKSAKEKSLEAKKRIQTTLAAPKSLLKKESLGIKTTSQVSLVATAYDSSSSSETS